MSRSCEIVEDNFQEKAIDSNDTSIPTHQQVKKAQDPSQSVAKETKRKRGRTWMSKNIKKRSGGHLIPVEYNEYGQVVGTYRCQVASQLGAIVRSTVPITTDTWKDVSVMDKNIIWDTMKKIYDLDPKQKKQMLKDAGKYFRNWKTNLTRIHIFEALEKFPDVFPPAVPGCFENVISPDMWLQFVNSRLTPEWQRKREVMQNYRKLNKYNHNLSRGGYVRIEEMMMKQSWKSLTELDRADLWIMGRTNAKGELVGEASEIQKNIDYYRQLEAEGKWVSDGPDDVLARALGTSEPRGRVRGVGHGVSRAVYWNTPTPTSWKNKSKGSSSSDALRREFEERFEKQAEKYRHQSEKYRQQSQRLEERLAQQDKLLRRLLAQQSESVSNVSPSSSSYYVPDPRVPAPAQQTSYYVPDPIVPEAEQTVPLQQLLREGQECQLASGTLSNIVASGKLIDREAGNNFRVVITHVVKPTCSLPYASPDLDMYMVIQAIGKLIPWPKDLVILHDETPSTSRTCSERPIAPGPRALVTQQPRERRRQQTPSTQVTHSPLERLTNIVSNWDEGDCVNLCIESDVFDQDMSHCYIFKKDILQFVQKDMIGQTIIVSFMRFIYRYMVEQGRQNKFLFVNPNIVANQRSSFDDRVQNLLSRCNEVKSRKQVLLVPWNDGNHWMLLILAPYSYLVYCCDPMNLELRNRDEIVSVIVGAFNLFLSVNLPDIKIPDSLKVKQPDCPQQPDNVACGWYVMKMMKELIEHDRPGVYLRNLRRTPYSDEQIDQLQQECATFMLPIVLTYRH